jgi:pyridinium-3,5-biscarboxylic acid mononucleotide sulfurtransferase
MPCLASRLPYGTEVDPAVLAQIDRAEAALRALGYRDLRVRHLGPRGKVELGDDDLARAKGDRARAAIVAEVRAAGYADAEIDDEPLRSGSFIGIRPIPLSIA